MAEEGVSPRNIEATWISTKGVGVAGVTRLEGVLLLDSEQGGQGTPSHVGHIKILISREHLHESRAPAPAGFHSVRVVRLLELGLEILQVTGQLEETEKGRGETAGDLLDGVGRDLARG